MNKIWKEKDNPGAVGQALGTYGSRQFKAMAKYKIGWLPGDGIGKDVLEAAKIVLERLQVDAEYILKLANDVSTDVIYPGRYMATVLPAETPQFAFADDAAFNARLKNKQIAPGSMVVVGTNFGCGSSREQAVSCLKGHELVIVARSFARIFLQNGINLGLRMLVCPEIDASVGDEVETTPEAVLNRTTGQQFRLEPLPQSRQAIIDAGGLIPYTRQRLPSRPTSAGA